MKKFQILFVFLLKINCFLIKFINKSEEILIINEGIESEEDDYVNTMIRNTFQNKQYEKEKKKCLNQVFKIETGDSFYQTEGNIVLGTYDSRKISHQKCTAPDHTFYKWDILNSQDFQVVVNQIINASTIIPKQKKIAWFGNIKSPADNTVEYRTRPLLIELSNKYPHLFYFKHVPLETPTDFVSMPKMVMEFYYVLDIGGNGYSGRLKYLLFSNRPLFLVERRWIEYYHTDLIPYHHYIPVHKNLSNLVEQTIWAHHHPIECKRIAQNAFLYALSNFTTKKILQRFRDVIIDQCENGPCIKSDNYGDDE